MPHIYRKLPAHHFVFIVVSKWRVYMLRQLPVFHGGDLQRLEFTPPRSAEKCHEFLEDFDTLYGPPITRQALWPRWMKQFDRGRPSERLLGAYNM